MKKFITKENITKIFIILSIIFFLLSLIIYTCRLIHYYKIEHPNEVDNTLSTKIIDNNDLKESNEDLIFYGNVENNYVYYSNQLWRILKIDKDNKITLITDNNVSSLVLGYKTNTFENSNLYNWLNEKYYNALNNPSIYLDDTSLCISEGKTKEENCKQQITSKVGLLSYYQYKDAGANESFLNIQKYFWTLTPSTDYNFWYVFDKGGINDKSHTNELYNGYGVRPVITLKANVNYVSGTGIKTDPYTFEEKEELGIGSYIKYSDYLFKIISKNDTSIKLVLDDVLKNESESITHIFSYNTNTYKNNDYKSLYNYLNNDFYNTLDKTLLVEEDWYIGTYDNYDYKNIQNQTLRANVGLLNIVDLFTTESSDYYTSTPNDSNIYILDEYGVLKSSYIDEAKNIKPTIAIKKDVKVISGEGTKENPYIVGE